VKTNNRWLIIWVSFAANVIIGSAYAWSVFASALIDQFGFTDTQLSFAFTLSLGLVPVAMILAGKLHGKIGLSATVLIGGIVFGAGFALAGFTQNIAVLYITYGTLGGLGIGLVYGSTIPNSVKWFPDKRGLAGGIIAGGFGMGAVVFAPLFSFLIGRIGVLQTFAISGVIFGVIVIMASRFIVSPPADFKPAGWAPPSPSAKTSAGSTAPDLSTGTMLKTPKFYVLWLMYTLACTTGLMIISQASIIAQVGVGVTPEVAAVAVLLLALANTGGRFFWGAVSDRAGRYPTLIAMYAMTCIMLILLSIAPGFLVLVVALMGIGLCFGGFLGVFPSVTAENFGAQNLGMNYGVMFTAFGVAAFVGPQLAATIREATGGFGPAFIATVIMSAIAIVITILSYISRRKKVS
jgi:OFA family oxalate/formate antiporter-like MFS transporter